MIGCISLPVPKMVSVALLSPVIVAFVVWYDGIRYDTAKELTSYLSADKKSSVAK